MSDRVHVFDPLESLREARSALDGLLADRACVDGLAALTHEVAAAFGAGGKVMACGNGGSMCDAAHFCEELTGRFRKDRRALPAIACNDPGHLSCVANDYGYEHVFARWVQALARPGDVVLLLSTSGNSRNCVLAAHAARERGARAWGLLGKTGGEMKQACDASIVVPGATADRIQELHMLMLHIVVEGVEKRLGLA